MRAYTERVEKGVTSYTIFCKLYEPGAIVGVLRDPSYTFSLREKLMIALDILKGLESMQKKKIVHRDLHANNYFIHISEDKKTRKRHVEVVIADLGRADIYSKTTYGSGQCDSAYVAPEAFSARMRGKAYLRTDVFAVGCLLFRLLHEEVPAWQNSNYPRHIKAAQRAKRVTASIERETKARRKTLSKKSAKGMRLSSQEVFEQVILWMVHPDPAKRLAPSVARKKLERALKSL